jgi:hypothetical protein
MDTHRSKLAYEGQQRHIGLPLPMYIRKRKGLKSLMLRNY